jgi:transcription initiation factor TFIIIB Brf1 subunit/transcription initiation factor TFIIB
MRPYWGGRVAIGNRPLVARTCEECGLILGRKHFQLKIRTWTAICNSCFSKRSRAQYLERINHDHDHLDQSTTLETATRRNQLYTLRELDDITEALELGFTYKEIAILVNRSYYSVGQTIKRYGLKNNWPTREQWVIGFE